MRQHALELLFDAPADDVVRREWQALSEAGLPSQLDHRGPSNAPHLTLAEAPRLTAEDEHRAADLVAPLLPRPVRVAGVVVLGGPRVTLARLLDVDDVLTRAVLDLRVTLPEPRHPGWLPHVTLARRVPRERLPEALAVLSHDDETLTLATLRRWDPDAPGA